MFRIISHQSLPDGKSRIVVETDDFTSSMMLRFLSQADKFAELFHYRAKTAFRIESSQKSNPEKLVRERRSRRDLLKRFREIPGNHAQRMRIIKEMLISEGVKITLDRLAAKLQIAIEEEKSDKILQINRLIKKRKSYDDIASTLSIPKATVARYAKKRPSAKKSMLVLVEPQKESCTDEHGEKYRQKNRGAGRHPISPALRESRHLPGRQRGKSLPEKEPV